MRAVPDGAETPKDYAYWYPERERWNHTSARGVIHELGVSCFAKNNLSLSLVPRKRSQLTMHMATWTSTYTMNSALYTCP